MLKTRALLALQYTRMIVFPLLSHVAMANLLPRDERNESRTGIEGDFVWCEIATEGTTVTEKKETKYDQTCLFLLISIGPNL